jgi:hypothetical protein
MAEQWPFKPFVESSTLSELTKKVPRAGAFFVVSHHGCDPQACDGKTARSANKEKILRELGSEK